MKIATILGARPQFIKSSIVSAKLQRKPSLSEIIIHTGQHYDESMSGIFFNELGIPVPDYNLGIGGGTHGQNTGRMVEQIERVLLAERPDWLMVYGDTDSTLAGAIAACKLDIPIAHVEAGLRSFNRKMPEEVNRILTDHAASHLFTPTLVATKQLAKEGIPAEKVTCSGDVMFDTSLRFREIARAKSTILSRLQLMQKNYILATIHRKENTDESARLAGIVAGLAQCRQQVILPLHPRTRKKLDDFHIEVPSAITVIEPVGYLDMVRLEEGASVIATDSGGVQKEAFFHGVPCITLRDETEWTELVELGANRLAGTDPQRIYTLINAAIGLVIPDARPYGDGNASDVIADFFDNSYVSVY